MNFSDQWAVSIVSNTCGLIYMCKFPHHYVWRNKKLETYRFYENSLTLHTF